MGINKYLKFEEIVIKIFSEAEYSIDKMNERDTAYDFVAKKDGKSYCVEIKYSQKMYSPIAISTIARMLFSAESNGMTPVLTTSFKIKETEKEFYKKQFPNLIILDIANLLYAVNDNIKLRDELISELSFTIDDIAPQEGFVNLNSLQHDDYANSLIKELMLCKPGKKMFRTYEEICYDILKNIFADDLALWKKQQKSNKDLYRFDLLCRIKEGNNREFWGILEKYFNTKYIIFEFKNYREKITQKEIYTTEKYLYSKALRGVGIIISANSYDKNAHWASKGCLRENGKLIMLLNSSDLKEMCEMKLNSKEPSDFLLNKLDELLLELEK